MSKLGRDMVNISNSTKANGIVSSSTHDGLAAKAHSMLRHVAAMIHAPPAPPINHTKLPPPKHPHLIKMGHEPAAPDHKGEKAAMKHEKAWAKGLEHNLRVNSQQHSKGKGKGKQQNSARNSTHNSAVVHSLAERIKRGMKRGKGRGKATTKGTASRKGKAASRQSPPRMLGRKGFVRP